MLATEVVTTGTNSPYQALLKDLFVVQALLVKVFADGYMTMKYSHVKSSYYAHCSKFINFNLR